MPARRTALPPELVGCAFDTAAARSAGIERGVLRGPGVRALGRDLFLSADGNHDSRALLAAYLSVLPREVTAVDSVSALRLWGVEVGAELPYRFVTTARHHSVRSELRVRRVRELEPHTQAVLDPVPALVASRTDLDLASLVVAGDWLVRERRAELSEVQSALHAATGRHCQRSRRAAELVRSGSESPQETRLRLLLVLAGLPEPECNVNIVGEHGFIARVDLYLRAWRIAGEYEGDQHRTDPGQYAKDLRRYEQLAAVGVIPVRVAKQHLKRPREVARRFHDALVSRGYDGPPPDFSAEWMRAFEPVR